MTDASKTLTECPPLTVMRPTDLFGVVGDPDTAPVSYKITLANVLASSIGQTAGTVAAGNDARFSSGLQIVKNLSDLTNAGQARQNLGLGGAATLNVGTSSGMVAAADDTRIVGAMQKGNNLSDLLDPGVSRSNLGLRGAAVLDVGTISGTVAAGDDSRITGAAQKSANLSDLANPATARTNLGAGAANGLATLDSSGRLVTAQIPTSLIGANVYLGVWNASTNTPTISSGVGTNGNYYRVSVAGSTTIDGTTPWAVGDTIIFDGTKWAKIPVTTSSVVSVAGRTGAVTLSNTDISGLGGASVLNVGTTTGTVAAGDDSRFTSGLQKASNLSDLSNVAQARVNLGLGGSSILNIGTTTNTVAAGDDSRIVNALSKNNNLSELANKATARTNLGLGNVENTALSSWGGGPSLTTLGNITAGSIPNNLVIGLGGAALLNVGQVAGTVAAGDDPRFGGGVTPTGLENYESAYNPFNSVYNAQGNGADDYIALAQCFSDAIAKASSTVYIPRTIEVSKTILIPTAGFKLPYLVSVDTTSSTLTFSQDPGGANGDPIQLQGAVPAGVVKGDQYYRYFPTPSDRTKVKLYNTRPNAIAGGSTGLIAVTSNVTTTGSITQGQSTLTVAAELNDEVGTNVLISGASGATGGFYIIGGVGTGTLTLNTTSSATRNNVTVTYVCWVDGHSFDGGLKVIYAPGACIKKHQTFTTIQGNAVLKGAIGSDIQIIGGITEALSSQFVPSGVVASCSGTNQVTITAGDTSWALPGVAFTLGGGSATYYVNSISTNVITAFQTSNSPTWPNGTGFIVGQGLSSGIVGVTATGTAGQTQAVFNTTNGLFPNLPVYFAGDTNGPHTIQTVNSSTGVVTFTNTLSGNLSNAACTAIGGDDGIDISSVRHAIISFHTFRHCGDAALRMQSNVAYYGAKSTSNPLGGVNTSQIVVEYCNFYNVYQTSTTTNNYMEGGGRDMYMLYNKFEYLRGSVKFAGRVAGSRNINLIGNIITSSDNHGFEIDSQSDLKILNNEITNVLNQGIFILSNNGPAGTFGLGIVGFPSDTLTIQGNILDNCGQIGGTSAIRITPDTFQDGTRFAYKNISIVGNTVRNVTNTANIGMLLSGSFVDLNIDQNKFIDYQGLVAIQISGRGETASGFINGIRVRWNEISMNNAGGSSFAVRIEKTSGTQLLNDITLDNDITGTCSRKYVLGGLNNVKMFNVGKAGLFTGGLMILTSACQNLTVDGDFYLSNTTGNATTTSLLFDSTTSTTKPLLNNNETVFFRATVTARDTSGNSAAWKIEGAIKQGASASTAALVGTPTVTVIGKDASASSWNVAAVADTTLGALDIQVTGAASTTIHWTARVAILEQY